MVAWTRVMAVKMERRLNSRDTQQMKQMDHGLNREREEDRELQVERFTGMENTSREPVLEARS